MILHNIIYITIYHNILHYSGPVPKHISNPTMDAHMGWLNTFFHLCADEKCMMVSASDSDDNMVPGTEMLADSSSGEDSGDEAYTQMMLSRRKTGSPTNVRSPKRRERNETKKKMKRRQSSSPFPNGF